MVKNQILESSIEAFENDFHEGCSKPLVSYLRGLTGEIRSAVLTELIATDLELRIRAGQRQRVESYFEEFPELVESPASLLEVLNSEFRTRLQFEARVEIEEFQNRFPDLSDQFLPWGSNESMVLAESPGSQRFFKRKLHDQGGLGNVWLGEDTEFSRPVAIKEVKAKFTSDSASTSRFVREAFITAQLEHPGVVPVYGRGNVANGNAYFAMQLIEGETLRARIKENFKSQQGKSRDKLEVVRLLLNFVEVCDVIAFAHSRGVVHRDIKPSNIMIGEYGETFMVDWGLAKLLDPTGVNDSKFIKPTFDSETYDQKAMFESLSDVELAGSPAFMSPEQASGEQSEVDFSSDIYGLGATLLAVIAQVDNPNEAMSRSRSKSENGSSKIFRASNISPWLRPLWSVCKKSMSATKTSRYQEVYELKSEVENFLAGQKVEAHQESLSERWGRFQKRNPAINGLLATGLCLIAIGSLLASFWINAEKTKAVEAQKQEQEQRLAANEKSRQLSGVVAMVSQLIAGTSDCGLKSDAKLEEAANYLFELAQTDPYVLEMPVVRGTYFGIHAKFLKGKKQYDESANWYRRAIDAMTSTERSSAGIAEEDILVVDHKIGLSTALHKSGDFEQAIDLASELIESLDGQTETSRSHFAALTAKAAPLASMAIRDNDKQLLEESISVAEEAVKLGTACYPKNHHHVLHSKKLLASIHSWSQDYRAALDLLLEVQHGSQGNSFFPATERISLDFKIGLALRRLGEVQKSDAVFDGILNQVSKESGADSDSWAEWNKKINGVRNPFLRLFE